MLLERIRKEGRVSIFEAIDGKMREELDSLLAAGKVIFRCYECDIYGHEHQSHAYIQKA